MPVVSFNVRNSLTEKVYPISAPIGDRIDTTATGSARYIDRTGARFVNEGTEEDPQWVVGETMPYAWKRTFGAFFPYTEQDLNNNYIELTDEHELYDSAQLGNDNGSNIVEIVGTGCTIRLALWTENVVEQGQTVTKLHSSMSGVINSGWFDPGYGYPPGQPIRTEGNNYLSMNSVWVQNLYVPDGKKPRISFNIETAKHGDYLYNILVVTGWYGYLDSSGETPVVRYGACWQRAISLSFAFGAAETIPGKTPSTTPNTTPAGGQGARNNYSYNVPMPTASALSGLNYFSSYSSPGLHLYKIDPENWTKLLAILWSSDWMKKISQALTSLVYGSTKSPADYILSCTKIALPVTIDGEPLTSSSIYLGPVDYITQTPGAYPVAKHLPTRYAETDTWIFDIKPYSDTYLDFDPYTRIEVHVPFCGTVKVSADACMRGQIEVKYIVDLITGGCCGIIRCVDQFGNGKIYSVVSGQCGISIPFASQENTIDKIAGAVGSIVAGAASGNAIPVIGGAAEAALNASPYGGAKTPGLSTAGGAAAVLGDRSLYVAIYHPQDITGLDDNTPNYQKDLYGQHVGYPAAWFGVLGELRSDALTAGQSAAYCECFIDPEPISEATDAEKKVIERKMQEGVYL